MNRIKSPATLYTLIGVVCIINTYCDYNGSHDPDWFPLLLVTGGYIIITGLYARYVLAALFAIAQWILLRSLSHSVMPIWGVYNADWPYVLPLEVQYKIESLAMYYSAMIIVSVVSLLLGLARAYGRS